MVRTPLLLMAAAEVTILLASVYFAGYLSFGEIAKAEQELGPLLPKAIVVAAVTFICLIAMGLYQFHQRVYYREVFVRVTVAAAAGVLVLGPLFLLIPAISLPLGVAFKAAMAALLALLLLRFVFIRNVDENIFRHRSLVFGAGDRARAISDLRRRADRRGFRVVGQVPAPGDSQVVDKAQLERRQSLLEIAQEAQADEIVVAMDDRRGNLPVKELLDCKLHGFNVIDLVEFLERESGKIRIDLVNPGWMIFSPGFRVGKLRRLFKRFVDIIGATIALLLLWPVMLLALLAIKFEDGMRAPVIYRQVRVGYYGELFEVLKFRSMRENAEVDGEAVWAQENDPRVTKVGNIMRKVRLDELPQILNVLRGEMSLVGPRPERPEFVETLSESIPYYAERHTVKPGVTGWAQLRYAYGSSDEDAAQKLQYDLYYVKNQTLMLDLLIMLQTVEVVLWGKGAR